MTQSNSYSRGIVFWVEDTISAPASADDAIQSAEAWRLVFGSLDNRVFRLMNLELVIAANRAEAIEAIEKLTSAMTGDVYIQAVVDLRIPSGPGGKAMLKHGIEVALRLQMAGIPFFVTSAAGDAAQELDAAGIERTRFFSKSAATQHSGMMPEDLARLLLQNFRSHVSWIDLSSTFEVLAENSVHPLKQVEELGRLIPYFGSCRDFVERWELRSGRAAARRIVLRSSSDHSDAFVVQCCAVVVSGFSMDQRPKLIFVTTERQGPFQSGFGLDSLQQSNAVLIIRLTGKSPSEDLKFLKTVTEKTRHIRALFIVPQDEGAVELLDFLSQQGSDLSYDDLPQSVYADSKERERMIRSCLRLVFQRLRVDLTLSECLSVHPYYVEHPEVLIDPRHWAMLLEADNLAEDISDTYEVIDFTLKATDVVKGWNSSDKQLLSSGRPISLELMLRPADHVFRRNPHFEKVWTRRSFKEWLTSSWQRPYSLKSKGGVERSDDETEWEDHCFRVAVDLAKDLRRLAGETTERSDDPVECAIDDAAFFLCHSTIEKMRNGSALPEDWSALEHVRWPHRYFPMPAALHRGLKREGRYLWVQSDLLDKVSLVLSGREALQRVEARAERHARRIAWLEEVIPSLPTGWRSAVFDIYSLIRDRNIENAWRDHSKRRQIWSSLYSVLVNAAPVSLLYYHLREAPEALPINKLQQRLDVKGPGKMLSVIRSKRANLIPEAFKITEPQHWSAGENLRLTSEGIRFLNEYAEHNDYAEQFKELSRNLIGFGRALGQDTSPADADALLKMLYSPEYSLADSVLDPEIEMIAAKDLISWNTMRGTGIDMLMIGLDAAEKLRSALLPLIYIDGYHLLALIYDMRNTEKEAAPNLTDRQLHKLLEVFLLSFEGIVVQLQACLVAAGRTDLASSIPNVGLDPKIETSKRTDSIDAFFRVSGRAGDYSVFTRGHSGERAVMSLTFDNNGVKVYFDPASV